MHTARGGHQPHSSSVTDDSCTCAAQRTVRPALNAKAGSGVHGLLIAESTQHTH
jgi:hypothetical protein